MYIVDRIVPIFRFDYHLKARIYDHILRRQLQSKSRTVSSFAFRFQFFEFGKSASFLGKTKVVVMTAIFKVKSPLK
jgi:hypothetical protein